MNLGSTLTQSALRWPDKPALVFEGRRWTYRQWNRWVNRTAHAFLAHGIGKGDRVAFLTWNLPEQVTGFYALLKIGAIPVPINYRLAPNEIRYIVDDCGARILVFEEALRAPVMAIRDRLSVERLVYVGATPGPGEISFDDFVAPGVDHEPVIGAGWTDPAMIMYTSGTTGRPKGVVRSHIAELVGAMAMSAECGFSHDDTLLNNKPLFHIAQLQIQLMPFVINGGTNVLSRGFDVHETLSLVGDERITTLHGVPTQMVMMVAADLGQYRLETLRRGFFGGQTLADDITRRCMALFPDFFANIYGSTEALMVTSCDYRRHPDKLGSVGKAGQTMEVRIIGADSTDPEDLCRPGEIGQLIARGPSLFTGYWGLPERTAQTIRDGWYFSGDAAVTDDEGFITVMGRMDHTIKSGGENIHPAEVENVLFSHPGIANAAVVGLPSRKWGQVVCAAIVRKDQALGGAHGAPGGAHGATPGTPLSAAALEAFCVGHPDLAAFKRPRHWFFVDEIPSNPTGKVERGRLKDVLLAGLSGPLE